MLMQEREDAMLRRHWRRNRRLIFLLGSVWFCVTFVLLWFARDLSFAFLGWPFSFYMAAQGCLLVYLALVVIYAWRMNWLDANWASSDDSV
jgi:putative solute:sodium symporter small subunit